MRHRGSGGDNGKQRDSTSRLHGRGSARDLGEKGTKIGEVFVCECGYVCMVGKSKLRDDTLPVADRICWNLAVYGERFQEEVYPKFRVYVAHTRSVSFVL